MEASVEMDTAAVAGLPIEQQLSKITPIGRFVLVEALEAETHRGVIILPDTGKDRSILCKVLKVGSGQMIEGNHVPATEAQVDDVVVLRQFEGHAVVPWRKKWRLVDGVFIDGIASDEPWGS